MIKLLGAERYRKIEKRSRGMTVHYLLSITEIQAYVQTLYRYYEDWLEIESNRDRAKELLKWGNIDKIFYSAESREIGVIYGIYISRKNKFPEYWVKRYPNYSKEKYDKQKHTICGLYYSAKPKEHAKFYRGFMNTLYNITNGIERSEHILDINFIDKEYIEELKARNLWRAEYDNYIEV